MAENLTGLAVADNPRRMGRPPLHVRPLTIRMTAELRARIEAIAGPNRVAQFLREAAEEKVALEEERAGKRTRKDA